MRCAQGGFNPVIDREVVQRPFINPAKGYPRQATGRSHGARSKFLKFRYIEGILMKKQTSILIKPSNDVKCQQGCPAGINIPKFIRLMDQGDLMGAYNTIREVNPFPSITGRVCPAFCQEKCRRTEIDDSVTINALERYVADHVTKGDLPGKNDNQSSHKRVAIVGSGPAGLSSAYFLANMGHSVTIYEQQSKPGGLLQWGIPRYRLPSGIVDDVIKRVLGLGVTIRTNQQVQNIEGFFDDGFDAVLLAIGAHKSLDFGFDYESTPNVIDGLKFLSDPNKDDMITPGKKVLVIGGGNAAIDSARTALRLSCKDVTIIYRRTRLEMPANHEEVEHALEEGVKITYLTSPVSLNCQNDTVSLQCIRMELGEPDESGRKKPVPVKGSEFSVECDIVIKAIGEIPNIPPSLNIIPNDNHTVDASISGEVIGKKGVFAAGDVVTGPASVIGAIAAAKRVSASINKYLGCIEFADDTLADSNQDQPQFKKQSFDEEIIDIEPASMPVLAPMKRIGGFDEVKLGFTDEVAIRQAQRCLKCDERLSIEVDLSKCQECYACQMICSLVYQGAVNPTKARISVSRAGIAYNDLCVSGCTLCIQHCLPGTLSLCMEESRT